MPDPGQPEACACHAAEPYSDTTDLERKVARGDNDPRYAVLEVVDEWTIRCRRCGVVWRGQPCPGWIYGDTVWRRQPPPTVDVGAPPPLRKKTPRKAGRPRSGTS